MWQNRPLAPAYAILYLDAIHIKLKRDGKIDNVAVYNVLGVEVEGHREILGQLPEGHRPCREHVGARRHRDDVTDASPIFNENGGGRVGVYLT